jgi:hypothetical protein
MFEVVQGVTDGKNRVFQLSKTPWNQFPIRLFKNGFELNPGAEFSVQGQTISLNSNLPEQAGDMLQAAYAVEVNPARGVNSSSNTTPVHVSDSEMLSLYLDRALKSELANQPTAEPVPSEQPAPPVTDSKSTANDRPKLPVDPPIPSVLTRKESTTHPTRQLESLRMLSVAMGENADHHDMSDRSVRRRPTSRGIAQGIEGLGDVDANSPFALLANSPQGLAATLNGIDAQGANRGAAGKAQTPKRVPRSLRMLEQRITNSR